MNRSMGLSDLYPFVLSDVAMKKLAFVHDWLRRGAQGL
ncbi:putative zinc-binding metallopeptidase [Ralstonia pseudosolanacearum]